MSSYRASLDAPCGEGVCFSLLQYSFIGSLLCQSGTVLGPGATVMRETDAGPTLTEPARVTDNQTRNNNGVCDPGSVWASRSTWQAGWVGREAARVSQGGLPGKGDSLGETRVLSH